MHGSLSDVSILGRQEINTVPLGEIFVMMEGSIPRVLATVYERHVEKGMKGMKLFLRLLNGNLTTNFGFSTSDLLAQ